MAKEKLKEVYRAFIRFEYCPHPWSRICYGVFMYNLGLGAVLSTAGYSNLAIMPYVLSAAGFFLGMEKQIDEQLDEREAYIQGLFKADEEERISAVKDLDLVKVVEGIDKSYETKLEERTREL